MLIGRTGDIEFDVFGELFNFDDLDLGRFDEESDVDTANVVALFKIRDIFGIRLICRNGVRVDLIRDLLQDFEIFDFNDPENVRHRKYVSYRQRYLCQTLLKNLFRRNGFFLDIARIHFVVKEVLDVKTADRRFTFNVRVSPFEGLA